MQRQPSESKTNTPTPPDAAGRSTGIREKLDAIDQEILKRLVRRAALVAKAHRVVGVGGATPDFESIRRWASASERTTQAEVAPLSRRACEAIFREIESACREALATTRVGYLGPESSYSHLAALHHYGQSVELVPLATVAAAFEEVHAGNLDFAIVPLENSTDGRIVDSLGMFVRRPLRISAEIPLVVHHHLLGIGPRSGIQTVISKPQAISQCRNWLNCNLPKAAWIEATSTTAAAERATQDPTAAAIASRQAAAKYGLNILAEHIEDNRYNVTRFAVIGRHAAGRTGKDKTTVLFQLHHEPGALADAMAIFKRNRLNLTWIESFPVPHDHADAAARPEYLFFVEFEGHELDARPRRALATLAKKTSRLDVLGSYPRSKPIAS